MGSPPVYVAMNVLVVATLLPIILPGTATGKNSCSYQQRLRLHPASENGEWRHRAAAAVLRRHAGLAPLKADLLAAAWYSLPQPERAQAVIYTENYGDASAVNVYRPGCAGGHQRSQELLLLGTAHLYG